MPKTFFAEFGASGEVRRYKRFNCGWSAEKVAGRYSNYVFAFYNHADHCNIEFRIRQDQLLGLMVNPSFPDDEARWPVVISFPILRHYHVERDRDKYQRPTNREIENTNRDSYDRRPFMTVDLRGMNLRDWAFDLFFDGQVIDAIEDIEMDPAKGFLGFSATAHSPNLGAAMQAKVRFNFLEFTPESPDSFKPTPYTMRNARHLNVLHILGQQVNGNRPVLYGARWDTRTQHTIYLNNFPEEYVSIARDVIEHWNDAFEQIGRGRPFRAQVRRARYAFDLRYPGITWIDDKQMSLNAPLGVGMASADVLNGKILWGGVSIWGGMIERIIDAYTPQSLANAVMRDAEAEMAGFGETRPIIQFGLTQRQSTLNSAQPAVPASLSSVMSLAQAKERIRAALLEKQRGLVYTLEQVNNASRLPESEYRNALARIAGASPTEMPLNVLGADLASDPRIANPDDPNAPLNELAQRDRSFMNSSLASLRPSLANLEQALGPNSPILDEMATNYLAAAQTLAARAQALGRAQDYFNIDLLQDSIGQPRISQSVESFPFSTPRQRRAMTARNGQPGPEQMRQMLEQSIGMSARNGAAFDFDRRLSDVAMNWRAGIAATGVNKFEAKRAFIKDLLLHEVGHMLGLGHNFKENILPARGTVPDKYLDGENGRRGLKAMAHDHAHGGREGQLNYTTVMGYKNGITDVLTPYAELKPGPNDILVLRYLYNQEYPVFPKDPEAGEYFQFVDIPDDGHIEEELEMRDASGRPREFRAAFFPSCNDFEASFGVDPFCNRWDRGYDATSIVKNYFEDYRANLTTQLYAFANNLQGGSFWAQEYYLWMKSFRTFGRSRLFYDYMRQKYADEIGRMLNASSSERLRNLLDFSTACVRDANGNLPTNNRELHAMFSDPKNAELRDLCEANGIFMSEISNMLVLPGPDRTRLDRNDSYMAASMFGGDARATMDSAFGRWRELARTPIKLAALYTATAPHPYVNYGGWLMPVYRYSGADGSFVMNTLYPKEFVETIEATVANNLSFGNSGLQNRTLIGRAVLSLGYMLMNNYFSNDSSLVDPHYTRNLREQTEFNYSLAFVEIERRSVPGERERARKFSATIHQMFARGSEQIPEIYLFTNNRTVIMPPRRSLLYPVTPVRWYSNTGGYYFVVKMDYPDDYYDFLKGRSVRQSLERLYHETMKACVQGTERNGLRYFFNDNVPTETFPGFYFPETISRSDTDKIKFFDSLEHQFTRYYSNEGNHLPQRPDPRACDEAIRGQGLLVLAASAINGYFLFDIFDYIEKGY